MDALETLKALANDTRFAMLRMLHVRELCVCELEVALRLTQSKVSYHLAVLRDSKLVSKLKHYTPERTLQELNALSKKIPQ